MSMPKCAIIDCKGERKSVKDKTFQTCSEEHEKKLAEIMGKCALPGCNNLRTISETDAMTTTCSTKHETKLSECEKYFKKHLKLHEETKECSLCDKLKTRQYGIVCHNYNLIHMLATDLTSSLEFMELTLESKKYILWLALRDKTKKLRPTLNYTESD